MHDVHGWRPNWIIAPAVMLGEWCEENQVTPGMIAVAAAGRGNRDHALALVRGVLDRQPLTEEAAIVLARGTLIPVRMWLALEHDYRAGLAVGLVDAFTEET